MPEPLDIEALMKNLDPAAQALIRVLLHANQQQAEQIEKLTAEIRALRQIVFGRKAEVMPDKHREIRRKKAQSEEEKARREDERKRKRAANRKQRKELPVEERVIDVPEEQRRCTTCGGSDFRPLGEGLVTEQIEFVPAKLVRIRWVRRKYACRCGECILTAEAPPSVVDGGEYGPGLHAHVAVAKCADSIPLHRQAKAMERAGAGVSRSTLCDLFHRSADLLKPVYDRLIELVAANDHVRADETPLKVQAKGGCRRGYMWTFIADDIVAFTFSPTRSGETPARILGGTSGVLQVDGYSGYNRVTAPDGRTRAGCWAHVRRKFFEALETGGDAAEHAMDEIRALYEVEHVAEEKGVVGTDAHRLLRQTDSKPVVERFRRWLTEAQSLHRPQSPMGKAIGYAVNNWTSLQVFLDDPKVALDNNASERALRLVALGRKNFLFAGHDDAAQNLAILQTLVSTCQNCGVNPQAYLEDVLIRSQTHSGKRIDELLPMNWAPAA